LLVRPHTRNEVAGRVTIGRVGCDLVLPDAKVSKRHAVISPTPDGFVINDLQSTNGTFVNGDPVVVPHLLEHLDRIRLGDTERTFRSLSG
jgi:pSer/pThr/pTyr-binding forkhead associated (FHA) protein